jgi:hypothetical protein
MLPGCSKSKHESEVSHEDSKMSLTSLSAAGGRWISSVLAWLLMLQGFEAVVKAQVTASPKLKIVILEGEGAINNIKLGTAREPIVEVQDENDRPLSGALVVFTLPDRGAGGVFADGSKSLMVHTDAKGQVVARGLQPNKTAGQFQIRVDASHQGLTASSSIAQTNVLGAAVAGAGISAKLITILSIIGGAAAAGAVAAASRGGSESAPAPNPTTITPGGTRVGPP